MFMNQNDPYVNLVFAFLRKAVGRRKFNTAREQAIYEKGYLIGFLAALARNDSAVYRIIKNKVDRR